MERSIYLNQKNRPVKIMGRGIASIVTYTGSKNSLSGGISQKTRCIWPSSIFNESKIITRKITAR